MGARFDLAIETVFRHEGLFSNHPNDPGGATNYGISLRALQALGAAGGGDINGDGVVDVKDILALDRDKAKSFYRDNYWRSAYNRINNQAIATKIFDIAVNAGHGQAHRILQRALVRVGQPVTVDGWIGEKTVDAVNACDAAGLLNAIRTEQAAFYEGLIAKNPKLESFRKGWMRRAAE